jgi:Xaa-Pro dipeptidase
MEQSGMDAVFVQGPSSDLQYLMGITREPHNPTDDNKYGDALYGALITPGRAPVLMVPRMGASGHVASELAGTPWVSNITVIGDGILSELEDPTDVARRLLASAGNPSRVGVIARQWARGMFGFRQAHPGIELLDAGPILSKHRMVKDQYEIELMQRAAGVTERAFAAVLTQLDLGVTANEIAQEIDRLFVRFGATNPSFHTGIRIGGPGVVDLPAAGRKVGDTPIQPRSVITFDLGAVVDGYASDFGRTVFWGEPVAEVVWLHDLIMKSQAQAIRAMRSGQVTAAGLNAIARGVIEGAGHGSGFTHRLGHGIGIDVHEEPFLFPGDETVLETGMCFTIEPSIRVPGLAGVRVEDVVMVTPEGGQSFHTFSRDLLVME